MPLKAERIDSGLKSLPNAKAAFIEPMLMLRTGMLPKTSDWLYELKLDGYRELGLKSGRETIMTSL
jgi:ATP-dependent DNA ligase